MIGNEKLKDEFSEEPWPQCVSVWLPRTKTMD